MTENPIFHRLELLFGTEGLKKLANTKVLVFGLGGVGSWAAEALVRSGIGKIGIIDYDKVCPSNINRQVEATILTIGKPKASVLKKRLEIINPECEITAWDELFCFENANIFNIKNADYVIDAIDSINHKLDLIQIVCKEKVPLFSSMGMALKIDPLRIKTASIWKTDVCPLARNVRQGLRKRKFIGDFTVVYSDELPKSSFPQLKNVSKGLLAISSELKMKLQSKTSNPNNRKKELSRGLLAVSMCIREKKKNCKRINGSIVTVTASAGFILASLVLNDVIK